MATMADLDRRLISEEIESNPSFRKRVAAVLQHPGGERLVSLSAKKSIANEFDPKMYPETRGEWPLLRKRAVELARALPGIVEAEIDKLPLATKMEMVRAVARGEQPIIRVGVEGGGFSDLGQAFDVGGIFSGLFGAVSSIYGARVTASAQKDIAKIQAGVAMKDLQTQITLANAQTAINQAQAQIKTAEVAKVQAEVAKVEAGTVVGVLTKDIGAGIPLWVLPVALGVLGLVLYFVFKKN